MTNLQGSLEFRFTENVVMENVEVWEGEVRVRKRRRIFERVPRKRNFVLFFWE